VILILPVLIHTILILSILVFSILTTLMLAMLGIIILILIFSKTGDGSSHDDLIRYGIQLPNNNLMRAVHYQIDT
jgi:hypothetical protein